MTRTRPTALVLAVVLLTVAGCAGRSGQTPAGGAPTGGADAYAQCLADHGVVLEEYTAEDGTTQRRPDKEHNAATTINDAAQACAGLLPVEDATATPPSPEDLAALRDYAKCLREHGVPEFPDPDPATGNFEMDDATAVLVKQNPSMHAAMDSCSSMLPPSSPGQVGG